MLKIKKISAKIAGITVLRQIETEFRSGSLLAVVGRNGGRQDHLATRHHGPDSAAGSSIEFDGRNLASVPEHGRAGLGIGYAPEDRVMFPTFTVEENLRLPCDVLRLSKAEIDLRLEKALVVVPQLKEMLPRSGAPCPAVRARSRHWAGP